MADGDALREGLLPGVAVVTDPASAPAAAPSGPSSQSADETSMSLVEHLSELRWRLFVIIVAIGTFTLVGFTRAERLLEILKAPLGDRPLYFTGLGDAFMIQLKLALVVGIV